MLFSSEIEKSVTWYMNDFICLFACILFRFSHLCLRTVDNVLSMVFSFVETQNN